MVKVQYVVGGTVTAVMSEVPSQLQGEFCKLAEICKTEKLWSAVVLYESGNQQNWNLTISEVAISINWKAASFQDSPLIFIFRWGKGRALERG